MILFKGWLMEIDIILVCLDYLFMFGKKKDLFIIEDV